ncbi:hypothetical protein H4Q26_010804 [Puccinia striiformis f. sp. tritici PST-130]|nr:hypothetical protein H4Q26_010804 [Puccinia striiformis f. sp. tritici PST-130]
MDAVNPTVLKTTIEAIPVLTEDNFSTWKTRITALFKLGGLKDQIINGEPALNDTDNTILCAIIIAKLSTTTHKNVVNSTNEEDAQLLWRNILRRFISNEPSNLRSTLVRMEDVGIELPLDIITYDLIRRLPKSFDNIKQKITHSKDGEDIKPEVLIDHLEIHLNELKLTSGNKTVPSPAEPTPRDREKVGDIEEEEEATESVPDEEEESSTSEDESKDNSEEIADALIPVLNEPVGRILRDRTLQNQPRPQSPLLRLDKTLGVFSCSIKTQDLRLKTQDRLLIEPDTNLDPSQDIVQVA